MEKTISDFVLEITKKLYEYEIDRRNIAYTFEEDKEKQQFFLGKADAFNQAINIIAELAAIKNRGE